MGGTEASNGENGPNRREQRRLGQRCVCFFFPSCFFHTNKCIIYFTGLLYTTTTHGGPITTPPARTRQHPHRLPPHNPTTPPHHSDRLPRHQPTPSTHSLTTSLTGCHHPRTTKGTRDASRVPWYVIFSIRDVTTPNTAPNDVERGSRRVSSPYWYVFLLLSSYFLC
jgi:hypothetical protein